ncbi:MAG: VOC family protein [Sinimarinibacterium flocculans]|uniref:VOC family protein n=1 Tax=Sinimarinibacterium flocculans TaxID=985250 RepID=UPI003C3BFA2C
MRADDREPIRQIAYVVDDLDAAIDRWVRLHGVGPWTVFRNTTMRGSCRGEETEVQMHVGLSYRGELQIELIQPLSRTPSPYQQADGRPRIGMHHIAWHSTDLDRDVTDAKRRGLAPVFEAGNGVVRVAYFEAPDESGPLYELIEAVPAVLDGFADGCRQCADWDGITAIAADIDLRKPASP